jgi:hypothetical protein
MTSWEGMWARGLARGAAFDANRAEPALISLLAQKVTGVGLNMSSM